MPAVGVAPQARRSSPRRSRRQSPIASYSRTVPKILIITGDGGESYEALYAVHRFEEEGWNAVVAAPSRRRLNLVMHDFKPGWDTYIERRGYGLEAAVAFKDVKVEDYAAVLILGGRAPEYLRNNARLLEIVREF